MLSVTNISLMVCPTEEEVMTGRETHSKMSEQNRPDAWAARYQNSKRRLVCVVEQTKGLIL